MARLFERRFGTEPGVHPGDRGGRLEPQPTTGWWDRPWRRRWAPTARTMRRTGRSSPITRAFHGAGFPSRSCTGTDEDAGVWLLEDLGDTTLFDALWSCAPAGGDGVPAVHGRRLPTGPGGAAQFPGRGRAAHRLQPAYPRSAFDKQSIRWDLNYFKYHFLKLAHIPFNEQRLEHDFGTLTWFLLQADTDHFLYRDFQSRNIMLREGVPYFIDYQGGRKGAVHYDVASLLYDAKAAIPEPERRGCWITTSTRCRSMQGGPGPEFVERYRGYVIIRVLQALGAYGYRGFYERKPRFLQSVPFAARNLASILDRGLPVELPELETVLERIVDRYAGEWAQAEAQG
jgi:aminoglycoside/choline kinase family phosphotransferase